MKQKQSGFDKDAEQKQNRDKILMMTESGIVRQLVQFQTASLAEDDGKNADQADIGQEIGINIFLFGFNIVDGAEHQDVADADRHQHLDIVAGKHQHQRRQKVQKHQPVQGIFGIFGTESILQQHQQSQYRQGKHQINVAGVDDNFEINRQIGYFQPGTVQIQIGRIPKQRQTVNKIRNRRCREQRPQHRQPVFGNQLGNQPGA